MAQNIEPRHTATGVPETPFNTPQVTSALSRGDALPTPAVATVTEDDEEEEVGNPASLLANVSLLEREDVVEFSGCTFATVHEHGATGFGDFDDVCAPASENYLVHHFQ